MFDDTPDSRLRELIRLFKGLPVNLHDYVLCEINELKKLLHDK